MSFFLEVYRSLAWTWNIWVWLTSPSIVPWVGLVAAVLAAFTVRTKEWLSSPSTLMFRSTRVAIVWLVLVLVLGLLVPGKPDGDRAGKESGATKNATTAVMSSREASIPSGGQRFDLTVSFVASNANPSLAVKFACDLLTMRGELEETQIEWIEIRTQDMQKFDEVLDQCLGDLRPGTSDNPVTVFIKNSPTPGQSVIRHVIAKIKAILIYCEVSVEKVGSDEETK